MKRILVLAGGGAMGLMQLKFLTRLEQETGKKIGDMFDLIVGTSVGSINGAVLSCGFSANEFYPIFKKGLKQIFKKKWYNPFGLTGPKYDRKNFDKLWEEVFKDYKHGVKPRISQTETMFMCTAVDRVDDTNFYFKSWQDKFEDWSLPYCVKASFAAPYFFGQMIDEKNQRIWLDGGVGMANLPADQAFAEAWKLGWLPKEKVEFTLVGCGYPAPSGSKEKMFNKLKKQGMPSQVGDFLNPGEGGMARKQSMSDQASRYEIIGEAYKARFESRYINVPVTRGGMDDISNKTLDYLEDTGEYMWQYAQTQGWKW